MDRTLEDVPLAVRDAEGLREVLALLTAGARELLGDNFVGAYLQGSVAAGDFDDNSDVDFFIAVKEDVADDRVPAFEAFHRGLFSHPCYWAQHLEGSYVALDALATLPPPHLELFYLDHGHTTFARDAHDHYLAVLWILRERGVTLAGPPASSLVPPIPRSALEEEVKRTMRWWGGNILNDPEEMTHRWYPPFAVMSFCRMLHTIETGEIRSKKAGLAWAKGRLDPSWQELMEWSWEERKRMPGDALLPAAEEDLARSRAFIRYVLEAMDSH